MPCWAQDSVKKARAGSQPHCPPGHVPLCHVQPAQPYTVTLGLGLGTCNFCFFWSKEDVLWALEGRESLTDWGGDGFGAG